MPGVLGAVFEEQTGDARGHGCQADQPEKLRIPRQLLVLAMAQAEALSDDLQQIAPEVQEDRRQRPQMQRDIEDQTMLRPSQQPGGYRQMRRAADG